MNAKITTQNEKGCFADYLKSEEVSFSKMAAETLKECPWAKKLLNDLKINRATQVKPDNNRDYASFNEIKSALFEVRFAYSLYKLGLTAEYEHDCGLGDSSVDFKIKIGNYTWLIELTSCRESLEVKKHTTIYENYFSYCSVSNPVSNSPEVVDIIKTQQAILNKVFNKKNKPIKFPSPVPGENFVHMILTDMRAFNAGGSDTYDYCNIAFGSDPLKNVNGGSCCRYWRDKDKEHIIQGLFDTTHPETRSVNIRDRIHVLGFIFEKTFNENELIENMECFYNPQFYRSESKSPIFCNDQKLRFLSPNGKMVCKTV